MSGEKWTVKIRHGGDGASVIDENGTTVATIPSGLNAKTEITTRITRAHLLAAAPDMAGALGAIVSMYERGYTGPTVPENVRQAFLDGINDARAALAKARGER